MSDERDMRLEADEEKDEVEAHSRLNPDVRLESDEEGDEPEVEGHVRLNPRNAAP